MTEWKPIDTAPKDGSRVLCWRVDWGREWSPCFLIWKTNSRIVGARQAGEHVEDFSDSYFGDPEEFDDYHLALPYHAPTHWMPLPEPPK